MRLRIKKGLLPLVCIVALIGFQILDLAGSRVLAHDDSARAPEESTLFQSDGGFLEMVCEAAGRPRTSPAIHFNQPAALASDSAERLRLGYSQSYFKRNNDAILSFPVRVRLVLRIGGADDDSPCSSLIAS
jgi:hypothetical protein